MKAKTITFNGIILCGRPIYGTIVLPTEIGCSATTTFTVKTSTVGCTFVGFCPISKTRHFKCACIQPFRFKIRWQSIPFAIGRYFPSIGTNAPRISNNVKVVKQPMLCNIFLVIIKNTITGLRGVVP